MKKHIFIFLTVCCIALTGCFEITREITLNEDGTGTYSNTNDMSSLISLIKEMGKADADKLEGQSIDSSFSLATRADSISGLSDVEKNILRKGNLHMNLNMKEEKSLNTISFPLTKISDIDIMNKLCGKVMEQSLKAQMGGNAEMENMMKDMPPVSSVEDYFTTNFTKNVLQRTLNKEKYATVEQDEYLKTLKESAGMGIPVTTTYIFNLPHPAKKIEGKNVKLSEDKKKITIKTDLDDFYDDPTKLEFRIEY